MRSRIAEIINSSIRTKNDLLENTNITETLISIVDLISTAFSNTKRVFFAGNGGSAADAQHLAAEFSGRFFLERKALPAEALHCNTSYMTAVANDYSYDEVYARLIRGIANEGDILIGLSTSGNSKNIVNAFKAAREKGIITISLTGENGGLMEEFADYTIKIPSNITPRIQECHIMIGHIICELVEHELFGK